MRSKASLLGMAGILLLSVVGFSLLASMPEERQEVFLGHGYVVGGVTLKPGKYLVVHKPQAIDHEGEACTYFYRIPYHSDKDAVAKIRCTPAPAPKVEEFMIKSNHQADGKSVLKSIQFPGSTEIHQFGTGS